MNEDDIRTLLRHEADQLQMHGDVPPALVRRAHRRIALNTLATTLSVVVLAGAAFAGAHALQHRSSPPGTFLGQPSPATATISACTSGQLRAVGSLQGAAGSREGAIRFTNYSSKTCTLQGTPAITLLDQNLRPITSGVTFTWSPPGWKANALPQPAGWPVVTVASFHSASVRTRWSNWCGRTAPLW